VAKVAKRGCGVETVIHIMSLRRGGITLCIPGVSLPIIIKITINTVPQLVIGYGFKDFQARRIGFMNFKG